MSFAGWLMPEHTGISDDLDLLLAALRPAPEKRLITVSSYGAGEPAIALAAHGAKEVIVYDIEDARTLHQLISFKLAAASRLGNDDYLALMGLRPASKVERIKLFDRVLDRLAAQERRAWINRRHWAQKGIYFANRQNFFLQLLWAAVLLLTSARTRNKILLSTVPAERSKLFGRYIARPWLVRFFGLLGSRVNIFYPEAEWRNSEYPKRHNRNPFPYFEHLVNAGLTNNPLFAHYFQVEGLGMPEEMIPPHMRRAGYPGFKNIGDRIKIMSSAPKQVPSMKLDDHSCHGAYLSNIIDYLDQGNRVLLCREIARVLRPGSPVLIYSSESFDKVPGGCGLEMEVSTSAQLKAMDRVHVYNLIRLYRAIG